MKKLAMVPGNTMVNGCQIDVVDRVENRGVILKDRYGKVITFIREPDNELASHYAKELARFAMACADRRHYLMNFELPSSEKVTQEQPKRAVK